MNGSDDSGRRKVVEEKMQDAMTSGFVAEFDPDEAEMAGATPEDALSEADAYASVEDLADAT